MKKSKIVGIIGGIILGAALSNILAWPSMSQLVIATAAVVGGILVGYEVARSDANSQS